MDTTQILLTVVITILTILLTVIGIQIVYILAEFRKMLEKGNKMLDDAGTVTSGISRSMTGMTGLFEGLKTGLSIIARIGKKRSKE